MAYIGQKPGSNFRDVSIKDSFTGDGSTVAFDLAKSFSQADVNGIEVFVDNVRQEPTVAYTVGQDDSGNFKRVTFTAAPAASASIYVLNPGVTSGVLAVSDASVTSAKLNADAITGQTELAEAPADTDTFLVHDASAGAIKKIQNSNLVGSALITGKDAITIGNVASDDVLLIYDTSAGVLKKITKSAFDALQPVFISTTPSNLLTGDGTGNFTIVIAGTDFDAAATFKLVTDGGTDIAMDTVTRDSSSQLTGVVAKNTANLTNANEPFDIVITNGNGLSATSANAITIDAQPAWVTSSGSLGTVSDIGRGSASFTIQATDPESGALTINTTLVSGSLPAGSTLVDNGNGTATISGFNAVGSNTTSTFTVRVADANSNTADRQFSITVNAPVTSSFTSSGTFSVPSGVSSVNVLVVAGGGSGGGTNARGAGGAGGLIYRPGFPVTPGGTVTVTVGNGGDNTPVTTDTVGLAGQDSVFGTLTAKGGGAGGGGSNGTDCQGQPGGSGGGGNWGAPGQGGPGIQPTQPGDSGTYGFGNPGGAGTQNAPDSYGGGGGGGAGAAGANGTPSPAKGGDGGAGKAYTISDGTTSVYYAGGGGGGSYQSGSGGTGGQGGGGNGAYGGQPQASQPGTANRGGGGGGGKNGGQGGQGGKGIVIVSY